MSRKIYKKEGPSVKKERKYKDVKKGEDKLTTGPGGNAKSSDAWFEAKDAGELWKAEGHGGKLHLGQRSYDVKIGSAALELEKAKGHLTVVDAMVQGSAVHGEVDFIELIRGLFSDDPKPIPVPPISGPWPYASET